MSISDATARRVDKRTGLVYKGIMISRAMRVSRREWC